MSEQVPINYNIWQPFRMINSFHVQILKFLNANNFWIWDWHHHNQYLYNNKIIIEELPGVSIYHNLVSRARVVNYPEQIPNINIFTDYKTSQKCVLNSPEFTYGYFKGLSCTSHTLVKTETKCRCNVKYIYDLKS